MKADPIEILVSNDDGFRAQGIRELAEALRPLGNVTIVAPDGPRSGASAAITSTLPIKLKLRHREEGYTVYSCTGTPVDCVKLAMNTVFKERKPDLLVTGVNHGNNAGICVIYSGTVGAAMEGCVCDVPALAVSLDDHSEICDMSHATAYAVHVSRMILKNGLPQDTMLSMNVPKGKPLGLKPCAVTDGRFVDEYMASEDARGNAVYWMTGRQINKGTIEGDLELMHAGYVTLFPIKLNMTSRRYLPVLEELLKRSV